MNWATVRDFHLKDEAIAQPKKETIKQKCRKSRYVDGWMNGAHGCLISRPRDVMQPQKMGFLFFPMSIKLGLDVGTPQPRHHTSSRRFTPLRVALFRPPEVIVVELY